MITVVLLVVLVSAYLIVNALSRTNPEISNARQQRTMDALLQAKTALIAYAASTDGWQAYKGQSTDQPGGLPCPDSTTDTGTSPGVCSGVANRIGRLPWATIGSDDLRDASGERLWYAVSSNFYKTSNNIINSDTRGLLTVGGATPTTNVVAVVIAPGPPLAFQNRAGPTGHYNPLAYLEQYAIVGSDYTFAPSVSSSSTFNDQLLVITQAELMSAVEPVVAARIERDIKPYIQTYFTQWGAFPFPAQFNDPTITDPTVNPVSPNNVGPGTSSNTSDRPQGAYVGVTPSVGNGLLPITASAAYTWSNGSATRLTGGGGSMSAATCSTTSTPVAGYQCSVTVSHSSFSTGTFSDTLNLRMQAQVANAGNSLATLPAATDVQNANTAAASTNLTASLASSGMGNLTLLATYNYTYNCSLVFFSIVCSSTTIQATIPNVVAGPVTSITDPTAKWFVSNQWYRQSYYAVAPSCLPGQPGPCSAPLNPCTFQCLTVKNMASDDPPPNNNKFVILVLAGRALNGSSRPSPNIGDYLEGKNLLAAQGTAPYVYEHRAGVPGLTASVTPATLINDRVAVIAP